MAKPTPLADAVSARFASPMTPLAQLIAASPSSRGATWGDAVNQGFGLPGAIQNYLSRLNRMQDEAQVYLDTAADPNVEGIQRAGNLLGGLGLKIANPALALMPSSAELRERGRQAGGGEFNQALGGAIGDLVNIPDPAASATLVAGLGKALAAGKAAAAAAPLVGKSMAVAPLGRGLGSLLADATPAEQAALRARLEAETLHKGLPDTWYHGSPADVYGPDGKGKFRLTAGETGVPALWASGDPFTAEGYTRGEMAMDYNDAAGKFPLTKSWYRDYDGSGGVYGLKSAAKNPLVVDAGSKQWVNANMGAIMRDAKSKGHDAVVFRNVADNYGNSGVTSDVIAFLDENAFTADRGAGQVGGAASGVSREQSLTNMLSPQDGIIAYHGSPHSFDKFSMDKIGTGEGAQSYGHGLYFAENEDVASQYRNALSGTEVVDRSGKRISLGLENSAESDASRYLEKHNGDFKKAAADADRKQLVGVPEVLRQWEGEGARLKNIGGATYQVHINAQPHEFLDWDKPLSEQPKRVQDALAKIDPEMYHPSGNDFDPTELGQIAYKRARRVNYAIDAGNGYKPSNATTKAEAIAQAGGDPKRVREIRTQDDAHATKVLKEAGVKGIRYKDQGSRGAEGGTYNYVIFDDKLITILKKYGIPMTAGAGGAMLVKGQNMPPDIASQIGG